MSRLWETRLDRDLDLLLCWSIPDNFDGSWPVKPQYRSPASRRGKSRILALL